MARRHKPAKAVPVRSVTLHLEGYEGQTIRVKEDLPSGFLETAMGLFGASALFDLTALKPKEAREFGALLRDLRRDLSNAVVDWDLEDPVDGEPLPQPYKNAEAFASLGFETLTGLTDLILSPSKETEKNLSAPSSPTSEGEEELPGPG